eukprot:Nk52_evm20s967 gene=Nk52_evmTU20s967
MGRKVVAEASTVDPRIQAMYGRITSQVGFLVGEDSAERLSVVSLVPMTAREKYPEENRKLDFQKLSEDWLIENAVQLRRMLVGRLDIVGIYAFCSADVFNKNSARLRNLLYEISEAESVYSEEKGDTEEKDRVLLHICSNTKKITCRTVNVLDSRSALKPGDYKSMTFVKKSWCKFETVFDVSFEAHLFTEGGKKDKNKAGRVTSIKSNIRKAVKNYARKIQKGRLAVGGNFYNDTHMVGKLIDSNAPGGFQVDVLVQAEDDPEELESSQLIRKEEQEHSKLSVHGTIFGCTYVNSKATFKEMEEGIKMDLVRSLTSRIELALDDYVEAMESSTEDSGIVLNFGLPKRAVSHIAKLDGVHLFCDYIFEDEKEGDAKDRLKMFLDVDHGEINIECVEEDGGPLAEPKLCLTAKPLPLDSEPSRLATAQKPASRIEELKQFLNDPANVVLASLAFGCAILAMFFGV